MQGNPNVIYIHTHDMGRYCRPYGYAINTPHMQRLAEEGTLFRNAYCAAPTCSPSRAALLTGQYPHQNGMFGLTGEGWCLNDYSQHLAGFLGRNGYTTALAGAQHEDNEPPVRLPYHRVLCGEGNDTVANVEAYLREERQQPFFLSIGFNQNHHHMWKTTTERMQEFCGKPDDRYIRPLPHLPDNPITRRECALFYKAVEYTDTQLGRVMALLQELNLEEDTLVMFTTDHGIGLPNVKLNLTEGGTGVALMFRGPGIPRGKVREDLISQVDVYPTICAYLNLETPDWVAGKSFLPLLQGAQRSEQSPIFTEQHYHCGICAPMRGVRTERYKYIRNYGANPRECYYNADGGECYDFLMENGYGEREKQEELLFDLIFDPNEACNVANEARYASVLDELRAMLRDWQIRTADPLLTHTVPPQERYELRI